MRKKTMRILIAAVLISSMLTVPAFAESAVVTGDEVNMRTGPGTNYRVVDTLLGGTEVTVTDRSNGSWYAVDYYGTGGFISSSYLRLNEDDTQVEIAASERDTGYINAMYVRFRSGPRTDSTVIGEYNTGKEVAITGTTDGWTACTIDGESGYIYSDFISFTKPAAITDSFSNDPYSGTEYSQSTTPTPTAAPSLTPTPTTVAEPTPAVIGDPAPAILGNATPTPTATPAPTQAPAVTATPVPTATATPTPTATPVATESVSGYINGDYVRFRKGPGTTYSIIDSYNRGKALTATGTSGDWTACTIDGQSGYVFSQYVVKNAATTVTPTPAPGTTAAPNATATPIPTATPAPTPVNTQSTAGYISGNNVRMRGGASMSSEILGELFFGNPVTITGTSGDWTAVIYKETAGYVYSQYVKEGSYSYTDTTSSATGSAKGQEIAQFALQYVGYNYSWGGCSPSTGFDCSGLVYYTYQQFGYTLNRVAADQAMNGVHVDELEPGDILCFYSTSSYIGHVGIYIGDGKFVHAANSATGVIVTELSGYYSTRGYEARRIVS